MTEPQKQPTRALAASQEPLSLFEASLHDLEALMKSWGQPSYRARQIFRHLYVNLATDVATMTDLPQALRRRLHDETRFHRLQERQTQRTPSGQTCKAAFALPDGAVIEAVLMVYDTWATVCVSTQAGCAMGCRFCATATLGLQRNLRSGEMVEQVLWGLREVRAHHTNAASGLPLPLNVVFMGMGEPFANYDSWWAAVERLHDPQGLNIGARRMTVSTVGLVPGIRRLAQESLPVNLAVSLHAPDEELRSQLVPVNRRYPIAEILQATREYIAQTRRRVSFEYVLLQGENDDPRQAHMLAKQLRRVWRQGETMLFHVNLIPWNPVPGAPLGRSERQRVLAFQRVLEADHIACTVRVERGADIAAACGQLAGQRTG